MAALAENLADAVERECSVVQFKEDHEAKNEKLDAMMMSEMADARKRIKRVQKAEADELSAIAEERKRLDAREQEIKAGALAKVEAERRRIAKCRAYIAAGE
ncbi:hypothetical protein [Mesorhizobium sp. CAU 1741]|uniref:hypothetical protein n=1 Tax=Mesorhizobium sp. CAU 1741 TaxID=3140366 RepID=UPI00325B8228